MIGHAVKEYAVHVEEYGLHLILIYHCHLCNINVSPMKHRYLVEKVNNPSADRLIIPRPTD